MVVAASWGSLAAAQQAPENERPERSGTHLDLGAPDLAGDKVRAEGRHRASALIQTWVTVVDQDEADQADPTTYGDPEADPGFTLARGRLGLDGVIGVGDLPGEQQLDYAFSVGMGAPFDRRSFPLGSGLQVVDAFGRYTLGTGLGASALSLGVQKVPFNRDSLASAAALVFQERTIGSTWLVPLREVGAVAAQGVDLGDGARPPQILLRAGLFNGNGSLAGDDDPGLLAAARLELAIGDVYRTWSAAEESAVGVGLAVMSDDERALSTSALAADLLVRFKLVTLTGEMIRSGVAPADTTVATPGVLAETTRTSLAGQLGVWIPIEGRHGIEVAGRFQDFDDATVRDDAGDVQVVHAGLTWRDPLPGLDLGGGYILRLEPQVGAIANDTVRLWVQLTPGVVL